MTVQIDAAKLEAFLKQCEDAEELGGGEYTVDLYDVDTPVSIDLLIGKKGVEVLAALELLYDEEMDGYYLGERLEDASAVEALIRQALA